MTLILGLVTKDQALLVSDRRLTWLHTGKPADDERNKAVVVCGHFAFGWTGLAEVGGQQTDFWMAEIVSGANTNQQALQRIVAEATTAFQRMRLPNANKRHAFLGVGFARDRETEQLVPGVISIDNYLDDRWSPGSVRENFTLRSYRLPAEQPFSLRCVGAELKRSEEIEMTRLIRRRVRRGGRPRALGLVLANVVRRVALRDSSVGASLLVASVPKKSVPAQFVSVGGKWGEEATFAYVPAEALKPVIYGPAVACPGLSFAGIEVWTERPPWWKD